MIEVDGEAHLCTQEQDAVHQSFLESASYTVLRFTNEDVFHRLDAALAIIDALLAKLLSDEARPRPQ